LTQQLLAFSRKQMLQPELIDLNTIVCSLDEMLRRLVGEDVDVRLAMNAREPWVKADVGQLQQVLVSLALNARDAMPRGGKLTIETAEVVLDEAYAARYSEVAPGSYAMIAVTDTGEGIPESVKPHLFEPFFTTKPVGEGTGLGLAMCYGIAKQSHGHISCYSEPGHGATFKIYLPRVSAPSGLPALPAPSDGSPAKVSGTETILLVEDDDALREAAGIVLQKLGYEVHEAANGREAFEIASRLSKLDLLLTDVIMPRMNGKELADQLLVLRPKMKVLFTSAYTREAIVHHGILEPGIDFLHKPYTPTTLARKAREALSVADSPDATL
jgi:CheY-like chemotaxis protein